MPIEWPAILSLSSTSTSTSPSETMSGITPIPEPPGLPFLGHVTEIDREVPLRSFVSLADKYGEYYSERKESLTVPPTNVVHIGEIYRLRLPGRSIVVGSSHHIVDELCDEKRFIKVPKGALHEIRNGVHDGLFTVGWPGATRHRVGLLMRIDRLT